MSRLEISRRRRKRRQFLRHRTLTPYWRDWSCELHTLQGKEMQTDRCVVDNSLRTIEISMLLIHLYLHILLCLGPLHYKYQDVITFPRWLSAPCSQALSALRFVIGRFFLRLVINTIPPAVVTFLFCSCTSIWLPRQSHSLLHLLTLVRSRISSCLLP
jgi:hypothetical protein